MEIREHDGYFPGIQLLTQNEELIPLTRVPDTFETPKRTTPMGLVSASFIGYKYNKQFWSKHIRERFRYLLDTTGLHHIPRGYKDYNLTYEFALWLDTIGNERDLDCTLTLQNGTVLNAILSLYEDLGERYSGRVLAWELPNDTNEGSIIMKARSKRKLEELIRTMRFQFCQRVPIE